MARESGRQSFSKAVISDVSGAITRKAKAQKKKCFFIKIGALDAENAEKSAGVPWRNVLFAENALLFARKMQE